MAFVAVKGELVPDVADACGRAGVRGLVVISSGFAVSADGRSGRRSSWRSVAGGG